MKRICKFLLIMIIFAYVPKQYEISSAKSENSIYAKTLTNCFLYKSQSMTNELDNIYFIVPETYFVVILDEIGSDCYKVQYDKYIGYVSSTSVQLATFVPIVKVLENIKCDIKETSGTQIWTKPSTSGNVLTTIAAGTCDISYISFIYGDIPLGGESNIWYYISYTPYANSTNVYEGYIYSENVTNLSEIVFNAESNPEIIENNDSKVQESFYISSSLKTVIIALISVPIILLISIILYKIFKKISENTNKVKNENKLNYHQNEKFSENYGTDYYQNWSNEDTENENLKNQLNKMRDTTFVKKVNVSKKVSKNSYPDFPTYSSEDDLL